MTCPVLCVAIVARHASLVRQVGRLTVCFRLVFRQRIGSMRSVHSTFYDGYTSFADSSTVHAPLPITPANNTAVRHFRLEAGYAAGNPKTNLFNMLASVMNKPGVGLANSLQLQPVCRL